MTNTGKDYEKLTRQIFETILALGDVKNVEVKHNVVLPGRTTNHQIDVYWIFEVGGIRYETIVQCKDWGDPVDQGELQKLAFILGDLPGQPRGLFVTRTGYQSGARQMGEQLGIELYELREPRDADFEGRIQRVVLEMNLFAPRVWDVRVESDKVWGEAEKVKRGMAPGTAMNITFGPMTNDFIFEDDTGVSLFTLGETLNAMPPHHVAFDRQTFRKVFEVPTFIRTQSEIMPRVRLLSVEADISVAYISEDIMIDARDVLGLILKNVISGAQVSFDKEKKLINQD